MNDFIQYIYDSARTIANYVWIGALIFIPVYCAIKALRRVIFTARMAGPFHPSLVKRDIKGKPRFRYRAF